MPFTYTYSADDTALGKATLKARVRLNDREDNNPAWSVLMGQEGEDRRHQPFDRVEAVGSG